MYRDSIYEICYVVIKIQYVLFFLTLKFLSKLSIGFLYIEDFFYVVRDSDQRKQTWVTKSADKTLQVYVKKIRPRSRLSHVRGLVTLSYQQTRSCRTSYILRL